LSPRSAAAEADNEPAPPRLTTALYGHAEGEQILLDAYRSGRLPHAWLLGGPPGIGKATLAFRMARFVLAHPDPAGGDVQSAKTLALPDDHPVVRRVAAQGHPDLSVLERQINEKTAKLFQDIRVDDVRVTVKFFGATAGEGGWRIAIVDSVDEMNRASANALLKVLEEPPPRTLLMLVSHAPGRVLPTLRSRCRVLTLRPLASADVAQAAAATLGRAGDDSEVAEAAGLAEGSVGRALTLLAGPALALRKRVLDLLQTLPDVDPRALHALGDALAGTEAATLASFVETVNGWLSTRLAQASGHGRMARIAETWDKVNSAGRDVAEYNLERKPYVFNVFGWLAEAARG
jgi:DNA polymerase III subunit delta'